MAKLSTHVLDLTTGAPAAGLRIELRTLLKSSVAVLAATRTGQDGRCPQALLEGESLQKGRYALVFYVAEYFRAKGAKLSEPAFLEEVVVQFGIAEPQQNYHVPLLVTPWSYSTYRGS